MQASGAKPTVRYGAGEGPLDRAHLEGATFGDHALRDEVLRIFDRQALQLTADIADATDLRSRAELAHTLKGAALGIGAHGVAEAAEALEFAADTSELPPLLARLTAAVTAARQAIAEIVTDR